MHRVKHWARVCYYVITGIKEVCFLHRECVLSRNLIVKTSLVLNFRRRGMEIAALIMNCAKCFCQAETQ